MNSFEVRRGQVRSEMLGEVRNVRRGQVNPVEVRRDQVRSEMLGEVR